MPRVIPSVFNLSGFGPPRGLTPASACPWQAHPASRLRRATERPVRTRSRYGSLPSLTSPRTATRWLILQKARRHTRRCSDCSWAHGFRYCFTPLPGCFSPFPHGTGALSVTGEYLGLEGGPPCFPPGFTCPAVLGRRPGAEAVRVRGSHPVPPAFPRRSAPVSVCDPHVGAPTTPAGLALPPVWPDPLSLAATRGVSVDFSSSGYLDVSVPRVASPAPMCSASGSRAMGRAGFSHSEALGS